MDCDSTTCNVYEALDKLFTGDQKANPLSFINNLRETFPHSVRKTWPSINSDIAAGWKKAPIMVRARCMIQDSLGSEFYAASCEVGKKGVNRIVSGVMRDSFGDEEVLQVLEHGARHCYAMVPVPCATEWYQEHFDDGPTTLACGEMKRLKLDSPRAKNTLEKFVAKFVDDEAEELRVNGVYDIFGVLSGHEFGKHMENGEEDDDNSSPTNVPGVPNLHVIHYEKVKGTGVSEDDISSILPSTRPSPIESLTRLRTVLTDCVGDELCADYLAMHLISSTYARPGEENVCALPLNVCGVKETAGLEEIMRLLAAKVKTLPFSPEGLSSTPFHSAKCHKTSKLLQGELQLANGTHLIIDETKTPRGKVEVSGHVEANLATLHKVISEQRINYDFWVYQIPFDVDFPVMILSVERSRFVSTPYRICLPAGPGPTAAPLKALPPTDLYELRFAIMNAKDALKEILVTGDVSKAIGEDFARMCADPAEGLTHDVKRERMSCLLILTRLVTALRGLTAMSIDSWKLAVLMEKRREEALKARFPPAPTAAEFAAEDKEN